MRISLGYPVNGIPYPFLGCISKGGTNDTDAYQIGGDAAARNFVVTLDQAPKDAYFNVVLPGTSTNERDPLQQGSFAHF